ncbi:MAG: aldehyde dehydrogenase family protein [Phycisphaerales bacterium]|nr:aldehyde dehydrogenase family protein [Phycisphaerales bacterium]
MKHPSLLNNPSDLIAGRFVRPDGARVFSTNPARPDAIIWDGSSSVSNVDKAVTAARAALPAWSRAPIEKRVAALRRFQKLADSRQDAIATLIRDETGKVMWDSKAEAGLLGAKVDITLDSSEIGAMRRVSGYEIDLAATRKGRAWFRPHGVMAVLGPFNFPAHLPNGHIIPALAMGNTIVLKPSDKTPGVGQLLAELYQEALAAEGFGDGVVNVIQGGVDVAKKLVAHKDLDGILFTGSWPVGRAIMEANLDHPGRMLALEMGGNNAAVILDDADLKQAVIECVRCAFITTGQRCTCTRRVIVQKGVAEKVISVICKSASNLIIGDPAAAHPVFMGPLISRGSRDAVLQAQEQMIRAGAKVLLKSEAISQPEPTPGGHYISPGILQVDKFFPDDSPGYAGADTEVFGPLLRISVVDSLDEAIAQANATKYGLAASIFSKSQASIDRFLTEARAGCVNVNAGTAGASSKLPFGGLGHSGNHRPAGSFSLDYCAYPVAGMLEHGNAATISAGMRVEDAWLS